MQGLNGLETGTVTGAASTMNNMEVIALIAKRGSTCLAPLGVHRGHSFANSQPAVRRHLLGDAQCPKLGSPGLAAAIVRQSAAQPAQALGLDGHQDGLTATENFVGRDLTRATATITIENS
jgi:hypothetical protein